MTDKPETVEAMAALLLSRKGLSYQDQEAAGAMLSRYAQLLQSQDDDGWPDVGRVEGGYDETSHG